MVKALSRKLQTARHTGFWRKAVANLFRLTVFTGLIFVLLYPLLNIFFNSFKSYNDMLNPMCIYLPRQPTINNYVEAAVKTGYLTGLVNTLKLCLPVVLLETFVPALAGYGFARYRFKESALLFGVMLFTLIVPPQVLGLPRIVMFSSLHLTGECFSETLVPPPIEPASGGLTECEVTLRFPADAAFRVYDEFSGESIRIGQDGSFTVTARMPLGDGWLYSYLLSFGGAAEVLSPPQVRRGLAQFARMACQRYEKDMPEVSNLTEDVRFDVLLCSCPPEEQQDGQEACIILEQKFCQSCGMPLTGAPQELGTEKDGSPNPDYCTYCYQNGAFTRDCTMQEMIDFCTPIMAQNHPGMTESDAAARMRSFFPQLKRWKREV